MNLVEVTRKELEDAKWANNVKRIADNKEEERVVILRRNLATAQANVYAAPAKVATAEDALSAAPPGPGIESHRQKAV